MAINPKHKAIQEAKLNFKHFIPVCLCEQLAPADDAVWGGMGSAAFLGNYGTAGKVGAESLAYFQCLSAWRLWLRREPLASRSSPMPAVNCCATPPRQTPPAGTINPNKIHSIALERFIRATEEETKTVTHIGQKIKVYHYILGCWETWQHSTFL